MRSKLLLFIATLMLTAFSLADKIVLGKLGQATERASIYSSMRRGSRVYYHVKPYEYLVIQETGSGNWYRVLLQNGAYGYVSTEKVAKLPYQVTSEKKGSRSDSRQSFASRSGSALSPAARSSSASNFVARESLRYIGTPYKWGGEDMFNGVDCSGFVQNLYGKIGVSLPRTAAEQAGVGMPIHRLEDLQPGDRLYFWENKRGKIGHTGIYLGGGYFCHSSMTHHGVATDYLGSKKWLRILVAARR